jgi:spore coat polysaccharide biosynthesis protein SpsF (cytidylyltransferase family)
MLEYLNTAKQYKITTIVRITADCPLIDPEIVDDVISRHVLESNDYTCNRSDDDGDIGDGLDVEVFQIEALERAYGNSPSEYELEHVTAQFRSNGYKSGSIGAVEFDGCSLDTQEDYDKISEYIRRNKCQFIQMAQAQDGTKP